MLEHAGTGDGVQVLLFTEKAAMEKTLKYVVAGNTTQMNDWNSAHSSVVAHARLSHTPKTP